MNLSITIDTTTTAFKKIIFYFSHNYLYSKDANLKFDDDLVLKFEGLIYKNDVENDFSNLDISSDTNKFTMYYKTKEINVSVEYIDKPISTNHIIEKFGTIKW